ncbi:chorismate lyase [Psychrobium sp. 1_MG-2023]|nr:chorismate lyase [Psychrobium sp. 1_MG-2023]MDP2559562.1 chorismate lyase [Psychrobium sp. 1_MG-2023]
MINSSSLTLPFPSGCNNTWYTASMAQTAHLNPKLHEWLFDKSSLTARLSEDTTRFQVQVLREGIAKLAPHEQSFFATDTNMHSREVILICDGVPQVYARTLIPEETLAYADHQLAKLGATSLGAVLFQSPEMTRSDIEATYFNPDSALHTLSQQLGQPTQKRLWARRSIFKLATHPLMVAEYFLPAATAYK